MMKKKILLLFLVVLWICVGCGTQEAPAETHSVEETTMPQSTEMLIVEPTETVPIPETVETEPVIEEPEAQRILDSVKFRLEKEDITRKLSDFNYKTRVEFRSGRNLSVQSTQPFAAMYMIWDTVPGTYTIQWDGGSMEAGKDTFLHEYIRLPEEVTSVTIVFEEGKQIYLCDINLYTSGSAPEEVQEWLPPCEVADVLVFPTHSDDDTLFFGALISHCAMERGLTVQTAFMVEHPAKERGHERLNGLWEMGVRHYPILGTMRDNGSFSLKAMEEYHKKDDLKGWQVTQIRRFKPLVIVGHDLDGEYGNGQHKLNALYLTDSVEIANDPLQYEETAQIYGVWNTPKLYLHLYEENGIILDVNTPMEKDEEGRTPFEVAVDAYEHHKSQHKYSFYVSQDDYEKGMDCKRFGLYRTLVEKDTTADIMENINAAQWRE